MVRRAVKPGAGMPRDEALRAFYQKLISIRRAHPALSRGTHSKSRLAAMIRNRASRVAASRVAAARALGTVSTVRVVRRFASGHRRRPRPESS